MLNINDLFHYISSLGKMTYFFADTISILVAAVYTGLWHFISLE